MITLAVGFLAGVVTMVIASVMIEARDRDRRPAALYAMPLVRRRR